MSSSSSSSKPSSSGPLSGLKRLKIFSLRKRNRAVSLPETLLSTQFRDIQSGVTSGEKQNGDKKQNGGGGTSGVPGRKTGNHRFLAPFPEELAGGKTHGEIMGARGNRKHRNSDTCRPMFMVRVSIEHVHFFLLGIAPI